MVLVKRGRPAHHTTDPVVRKRRCWGHTVVTGPTCARDMTAAPSAAALAGPGTPGLLGELTGFRVGVTAHRRATDFIAAPETVSSRLRRILSAPLVATVIERGYRLDRCAGVRATARRTGRTTAFMPRSRGPRPKARCQARANSTESSRLATSHSAGAV